MSTDFEIITYQKPQQSHVEEHISEYKNFDLQGTLGSAKGNILVTRTLKAGRVPSFTIDGPFQIDETDVPEEILPAILCPRWLTQISLPMTARKEEISFAKSLACHIAKSCQGIVYDPQAEIVLWPKGAKKRYWSSQKEERIRLVKLEWFLPATMACPRAAELLLSTLANLCPESLPKRFGSFEPFQGKFDANDTKPFLDTWRVLSKGVSGNHLFWSAGPPCFGGSIFFPPLMENDKPSGAYSCIHISLSFDGRALHQDTRWCETIVNLFLKAAKALNAFYAAGYVLRNVIAKRSIWFDGKSEDSPMPRSKWWLGIPNVPTWLAWYGRPYKPLVEKAVGAAITQETTEGVFIRLGTEPMDRDQLKKIAPSLPSTFLVRYDSSAEDPAYGALTPSLIARLKKEMPYWEPRPKPHPAEHIPNP